LFRKRYADENCIELLLLKSLVILFIVTLMVIVQSAEAVNYTTTITTTVTIVTAQEKATEDAIPTNQQETTSETASTNQQSTASSTGSLTSPTQLTQTSFNDGLSYPQEDGEIQYLTSNPTKLPEFEPNPVYAFAEPEVIAPLVASTAVAAVWAVPIKPVGFSAASIKTFRVAIMYRRSMLFSKTQTAFAVAFLALAGSSFSNFMNLEIASLVLLPVFFGLVIYHNVLWYVRYSYCRVDTLSRQVLVIFPVLGLLGYLYMIFTEAIPFDILQAIAVVGLLVVVPNTIFTALSFWNSRLEAKWILIASGLAAVMSGIILSIDFMIGPLVLGDWLVLAGCGLVVLGQWNLSTKYSTE